MLLDILFPKYCLSCGAVKKYICQVCSEKLEYIEKNSCLKCNRIHNHGLFHENCKEKLGLDGYLSILYYNPTAKSIIKNIKYRLVKDACREFFSLFPIEILQKYSEFKKEFPNCVIEPVPLHRSRQAMRGFNQAYVIAEFFQELLQFPISSTLKRVKKTMPQAQTNNKIERMRNMKNSFIVKKGEDVRGKDIILIDDVITTGNTIKEATKVLKKAGARYVFAFSIAHG